MVFVFYTHSSTTFSRRSPSTNLGEELLTLDSSMTVGEAEKALTDCFIEGCFVDIYPRDLSYRITKDMPLKDIKHLQTKFWDTFDINMVLGK